MRLLFYIGRSDPGGPDMESVKEYYDTLASSYDSRYTGLKGRYFDQLETSYVFDLLTERNALLLDIGTGTGRIASEASKRGQAVEAVGIDVSRNMVHKARQTDRSDSTEFLQMNAVDLGFEDNTFDAVTVIGTFEYVSNLQPFFREIQRVLSPGGEVVFTVLNANRYRSRDLVDQGNRTLQEHTISGLRSELHRAGFSLTAYHGTLFLNSYLWVAFRAFDKLGIPALKSPAVKGTVLTEQLLNRLPFAKRRSGELVVRAELANPAE